MDGRGRVDQSREGCLPVQLGMQPWWRGPVFGGVSPAVLTESTSKGNLVDPGSASVADKDKVDANVSENDQNMQPALSNTPAIAPEYGCPQAPMEIGQSIACATYPYPDPYFAGAMTPYGPQALVHPQIFGIPHARMPLPLEMTEEPVYVNAKQYHGIMRRRQARAKAELERKAVKARKPYLHESRHQHAMRRVRGCGGRFLNTKKNDGVPAKSDNDKSATSHGTQSASSSGSEAPPCDHSANPDGSNMQEGMSNPQMSSFQKGGYQPQSGYPLSFPSEQDDRVDEGDCSGPQCGGMLVNQPNRAVTIR